MSEIEKCAKEEGPVTREWLEGQVSKGRPATPQVLRKLAGMLERASAFKQYRVEKVELADDGDDSEGE